MESVQFLKVQLSEVGERDFLGLVMWLGAFKMELESCKLGRVHIVDYQGSDQGFPDDGKGTKLLAEVNFSNGPNQMDDDNLVVGYCIFSNDEVKPCNIEERSFEKMYNNIEQLTWHQMCEHLLKYYFGALGGISN